MCGYRLDFVDWNFCLNDTYDLVFRDPVKGGERIFKAWEIKSKGNAKINDVKGGWWQANDDRLIFTHRKFNPNSEACKKDFQTSWTACKGDEVKQRGTTFSNGSYLPLLDLFARWARIVRDRNRDVVPVFRFRLKNVCFPTRILRC